MGSHISIEDVMELQEYMDNDLLEFNVDMLNVVESIRMFFSFYSIIL